MAEARSVEEAEGRGDVRDVRIRNHRAAGTCGNSAGRPGTADTGQITVWRRVTRFDGLTHGNKLKPGFGKLTQSFKYWLNQDFEEMEKLHIICESSWF